MIGVLASVKAYSDNLVSWKWTYSDQLARSVLLAVALLDHLLRCGRVAVVHSCDIYREHAREILFRKVKEALDLGDASVGNPVYIVSLVIASVPDTL